MTSNFATINGATLHYQEQGQGHAIILLHAGIADSRMWQSQIDMLAQKYRVIAPDARGYGESPAPTENYVLHRDVHALTNYLEIKKCILMGASMGGGTAIDFTLAYPDMVEKLILVGSAISGYDFSDEETIEGWKSMYAPWEASDFDAVADIEIDMWVVGRKRKLEAVDAKVIQSVREMLLKSYETPDHDFEQEPDVLAIDRLDQIQVSTLVIIGNHDTPDIQTMSEILENDIPKTKLVKMRGVAHLPNMEKPSEFNKIIQEFLES